MSDGFAKAVDNWAARATRRLNLAATLTLREVADRIIERSPVRTGLFRSNWQLGVDGPVLATVKDTGRSDVNGMGEIPERAAGHRYFFTNALPYALRLEYGYSGPDSLGRMFAQPPAMILGGVPLEFEGMVGRAAATAKRAA